MKIFNKENKWIIAALVFFIAWKFILIGILWNNRLVPPEPDDSYSYINQIASVKNCPHIICEHPSVTFSDPSGFIYLSYRIFFGMVAKLFFLTPEQTFHFNFYLGTVLMAAVILFFLKKITDNKKVMAFSLFFMAFYHGTGETHGFHWVTPGFYAVLLFFLILALILSPKKHFVLLIFITSVFVFTHPLSTYFSFILVIFYFFLLFFKRKNDFLFLKKIALVLSVTLVCHLSVSFYLEKQLRTDLNYFSINNQFKQLKNNYHAIASVKNSISVNSQQILGVEEKEVQEKLDKKLIKKEGFLNKKVEALSVAYFKWFFPVWLGFLPLILFLVVLFYYRRYALLSLYFSSLTFFLISTLSSEFGYRSAFILWVSSFLLYGFGFFYSFHLIKSRLKNKYLSIMAQSALSGGLTIFIFLNSAYSLVYATNMNIRDSYNIGVGFSEYLISNTQEGEPINIDPTLFYYDTTSPLISRNQARENNEFSKYTVALENNNDEKKINNSRINIIFQKIMDFLKIEKENIARENKNTPENFHEEARFGSVIIYKNDLWQQK